MKRGVICIGGESQTSMLVAAAHVGCKAWQTRVCIPGICKEEKHSFDVPILRCSQKFPLIIRWLQSSVSQIFSPSKLNIFSWTQSGIPIAASNLNHWLWISVPGKPAKPSSSGVFCLSSASGAGTSCLLGDSTHLLPVSSSCSEFDNQTGLLNPPHHCLHTLPTWLLYIWERLSIVNAAQLSGGWPFSMD